MSATDTPSISSKPEPVEPGWYAYSGGAQTMIFHLRTEPTRQWSVHVDNGSTSECEWGYIEQALSVWDLVPLKPTLEEQS